MPPKPVRGSGAAGVALIASQMAVAVKARSRGRPGVAGGAAVAAGVAAREKSTAPSVGRVR